MGMKVFPRFPAFIFLEKEFTYIFLLWLHIETLSLAVNHVLLCECWLFPNSFVIGISLFSCVCSESLLSTCFKPCIFRD